MSKTKLFKLGAVLLSIFLFVALSSCNNATEASNAPAASSKAAEASSAELKGVNAPLSAMLEYLDSLKENGYELTIKYEGDMGLLQTSTTYTLKVHGTQVLLYKVNNENANEGFNAYDTATKTVYTYYPSTGKFVVNENYTSKYDRFYEAYSIEKCLAKMYYMDLTDIFGSFYYNDARLETMLDAECGLFIYRTEDQTIAKAFDENGVCYKYYNKIATVINRSTITEFKKTSDFVITVDTE